MVFAGTSTAVRNKESSRRRVQLAPSVRSIRTMRRWPREVATGSQHSIAKLGEFETCPRWVPVTDTGLAVPAN